MPFSAILWDDLDNPDGNIHHIAAHCVTMKEVEEVFANPDGFDLSNSSGRPIVFGHTKNGRFLIVVYEEIATPNDIESQAARPITAFDVKERKNP